MFIIKFQRCDACKVLGATVGCCCSNCSANFHFACARKQKCVFLLNKEVYCQHHASLGPKESIVKDSEMKVDRCILVYTDLEKPGRKMIRALDPTQLTISIGTSSNVGSLYNLYVHGESTHLYIIIIILLCTCTCNVCMYMEDV